MARSYPPRTLPGAVGAGHARENTNILSTKWDDQQRREPSERQTGPSSPAQRQGFHAPPGVYGHHGYAAARCFEESVLLGDTRMLAWVLMPDHVHWLVQVGENDSLSTVVNRLKSASGRQVNRLVGKQGTFWQKTFHDHALREDEDLWKVARYMVANPLRAGLVQRIGDYPFWNGIWV